jgi:mono/diheme cytochrome c family protein
VRPVFSILAQCVAIAASLHGAVAIGADQRQGAVPFEREVWPVLAANCIACHGAEKPKGGLDLRTASSILRGGESGAAIKKNDADTSLIVERIASGEMPPGDKRKLTPDEVAIVRRWIQAGAPADQPDVVPPPPTASEKARQFWAFRPLAAPPPPRVEAIVSTNAVDVFLLARLSEKGLTFSQPADPVTLVRRLSFDLLGLPPTLDEVDQFLADSSPDAYERLVNRLLASPHFGERWGRHWLDVAGYADTVGFDIDANLIITSDGKWLYRDYVIRCFNDDKPFDRFLTEQLAGDELYDWRNAAHLTPEMRESLIATGFLRTARDLTHEDVGVIPQNFHNILHDTLEIVGTSLLGLTVNCARCHDHKFDPISQEDYYRLTALFTPAYNPHAWRPVTPFAANIQDRVLADLSPVELAEFQRHNGEVDRRIEALTKELSDLRRPCQAQLFDAKLAALPESIRGDLKTAIETPAYKRNEIQKYLAEKLGGAVAVKSEEVSAALSDADKATSSTLEAKIAQAKSERRTWGKIQACWDLGPPPQTHVLLRGNYETPGKEVSPGFLRVLCSSDFEATPNIPPPSGATSGRRTALARWLTRSDSPAAALVARVMINRIWAHLFGRGIVATSDNFGAQGQRPTHPELLEWLAAEFVENGWRIKPLIRQLVTSAAYRQATYRIALGASQSPDPAAVDPANDLLWKMRLRRLESEIVRDAILATSGKLNSVASGPPILTRARPDGLVVVDKDKLAMPADAWRRSVYLLARRAYNLSLLTVFDQPLVATNCLCRDASAVPLQSLTMLNDDFVSEQAAFFAERVEAAASTRPNQIELVFRLALGRRPNANEATWCEELLARQTALLQAPGTEAGQAAHQALIQLCRTLLNTSEFLYAE